MSLPLAAVTGPNLASRGAIEWAGTARGCTATSISPQHRLVGRARYFLGRSHLTGAPVGCGRALLFGFPPLATAEHYLLCRRYGCQSALPVETASRHCQSVLVVDGRLTSVRYDDSKRVDAIDHGPLVVEADADVRRACRDIEWSTGRAGRASDEQLQNFIRSQQ